MSNKILEKERISLVPNQKTMEIPKVLGYILGINVKLITNHQTIDTENYNLTIRQFPYSEGYFKMDYIEETKDFKFESIYRIDLQGSKIEEFFSSNHTYINVRIEGHLNIKQKDNQPVIDDIIAISANDEIDLDVFNNLFIESGELKYLLTEYPLYESNIISRY